MVSRSFQDNHELKTVAILGMGRSIHSFFGLHMGNVGKVADEYWGINHMGALVNCDRVFFMDDLKHMEDRFKQVDPDHAGILERYSVNGVLKQSKVPVYTSKPYPDYPNSVEYPLQDVVDSQQCSYMNSTVAYAFAYALHVGVEQIQLWGCDFSYPDRHAAEKGRGCCEFWIGRARERGVDVVVPSTSNLTDADCRAFYGYKDQPELAKHQGEVDNEILPKDNQSCG